MLTINQHPVVAADYGEHADRSRESHLAALASEIAERIEEMEQVKVTSGGGLITRLSTVRSLSPVAFRIIIQLLHGNTDALESYAQRAKARGVSKQTVFLEVKNELAKVRSLFPLIVQHVETMQLNALAHEDPMSNSDAIREGRESVG